MNFHGLFLGVDRYQSHGVKFLSSAVRDATALHALFVDGFGGAPVLLTDAQVTRAAVVGELRRLAATSTAGDLVVISFSGHGSTTHELVPYDADPARLAETALPLDQLAKLLNDINAATMLCVLDCCFAGGVDAKVLIAPTLSRDLATETALLDQIAGRGRIVLVASGPNERAYEDNALGHGYLTYYLIEAVQGAPEVLTAGKIDLYKLLNQVTRRVVDASSARRQEQHPGFRGSVEGIVSWPVLKPGPRYAAAFPDRVRLPATTEVHSLEVFGLPDALLDAWAAAIPGLNDLQLAAINEYGVLDGNNLLVTAPTSSGKTMVGELAALQAALDRRRAVFLLPLRALANDKYREFTDKYGPMGIVTIRSTGEVSDDNPAFVAGRYDICLTTHETFSRMALANPHLLRQIGTVVVDEVQTITDPNRGPNLELLLTLIKSRRPEGVTPQVICLSAVIGDTSGLERWFDGRHLRHETRPVPLVEGVLGRSGGYRFVESDGAVGHQQRIVPRRSGLHASQDLVTPLVKKLVEEGKQVIVFRVTKPQTISCAEDLATNLGLSAAQAALEALPDGDPTTSSQRLRRTLAGGVGFHNADLTRDERRVLEEEFRRDGGGVRVLVATTTLAMGINTPAAAVVIDGLTHPLGRPYTVAEYKNMVGRAGRLGYSERGESYLIESPGLDEARAWNGYVHGKPEDVRSVFANDPKDEPSLVLRVLAALRTDADGSVDTDLLVSFLESTFGVFQQRMANPSWAWSRHDIQVPVWTPHLRESGVLLAERGGGGAGYRAAFEYVTEVRGIDDARRAAEVAELNVAPGRHCRGRRLAEAGGRQGPTSRREQRVGADVDRAQPRRRVQGDDRPGPRRRREANPSR